MLSAAAMRFATLSNALVLAVLSAALPACGPEAAPPEGPVGRMVTAAAERNGVPASLMLAIADVEGGLRLPAVRDVDEDAHVPVAGVLELRHGRYDSLRRGAELMGASELALSRDLDFGTEAGARVLDDLADAHGIDRGQADAWAPVVERLSGHKSVEQREEYRARVFSLLRHGGTLAARGGETISLPPNPDVSIALTIAPPALMPQGNPEYPGAIWFDTDCTDKCNTSRNADITMIAIHDTEVDWDSSVATLQNDPGKSVHYIVDADGTRVGQFIPESYDGWHVGNSYFNNRMVGIENVGFASKDEYQTALYTKTADLVKTIAAKYAIPLDRSHVVAHQEVPDGVNIPESSPPCPDSPNDCIQSGNYGGFAHHNDPGVYWEFCQFMEMTGGSCKCTDSYDLWNCVHDLSMMTRCKDGAVEIVHCSDTCVVEAIGTDDHCTAVTEATSSGAGGAPPTSSGEAAAAGDPTAGVGGATGLSDAPSDEADSGCGCKTGSASAPSPGAALTLALAALAALRRRRHAPL